MSITPVDKPPDGQEPPDEASFRRVSALRRYVGRFCSWLSERVVAVAGRNRDGVASRARQSVGSGRASVSGRTSLTDVEDQCPVFEKFPDRDRPLTYPGREMAGINTPDVVGIETEQGLRLSVPENPDATLTSDVWTTVEP